MFSIPLLQISISLTPWKQCSSLNCQTTSSWKSSSASRRRTLEGTWPKLGMALIVAGDELHLCDPIARTNQTHNIWDFLDPIKISGGQDGVLLIIDADGLILLGNSLTEELQEVLFQDIAALLYRNGWIFGLLHDKIPPFPSYGCFLLWWMIWPCSGKWRGSLRWCETRVWRWCGPNTYTSNPMNMLTLVFLRDVIHCISIALGAQEIDSIQAIDVMHETTSIITPPAAITPAILVEWRLTATRDMLILLSSEVGSECIWLLKQYGDW